MSAFICNPSHIGLIAAVVAANRNLQKPMAAELASVLAQENIRSVAHCYPEDNDGARPGPALFDNEIIAASKLWAEHYLENFPKSVDHKAIVSICRCYEYQSCECHDWETTRAYRIVQRAKDVALRSFQPKNDIWEWSDQNPPKAIVEFFDTLGEKAE